MQGTDDDDDDGRVSCVESTLGDSSNAKRKTQFYGSPTLVFDDRDDSIKSQL